MFNFLRGDSKLWRISEQPVYIKLNWYQTQPLVGKQKSEIDWQRECLWRTKTPWWSWLISHVFECIVRSFDPLYRCLLAFRHIKKPIQQLKMEHLSSVTHNWQEPSLQCRVIINSFCCWLIELFACRLRYWVSRFCSLNFALFGEK